MKSIVIYFISVFNCANYVISNPIDVPKDTTLQLVHVLFRHGERTTDVKTIYPTDPHKNLTFYPLGLGELTKKGKQTEYKLGKALRKRYGDFLGEIYSPDILEATTSDTNRTKSSLELVLAGLFPPVGDQIFEPGLLWQPIPFVVSPRSNDKLFSGIFSKEFEKPLEEYKKSPKGIAEAAKYKETFDYLTEHSGWNFTDFDLKIFYIYMGLKVENELGLELPDWTKKVFPDRLDEMTLKFYHEFTATTELRQLACGYLLKKIIDDSKAKANDELVPKTRKLFMYSAHELNLAFMLITMDVFQSKVPPYGSCIMFELHKIDGVYGLKIYYENYESSEPQLLKLPACEEFCPLDKFVALNEEFLPL